MMFFLPKDDQLSESIQKKLAKLPQINIFRLLATMPPVFDTYLPFAQALYAGKFDPKLRQIALLRVACQTPSVYLQHLYTPVCKTLGVSLQDIEVILSKKPVTHLDEEANFLCHVADEITLKATLTDETAHAFYKRYSFEEGTKLLMLLGAAGMIGRLANVTKLPTEQKSPLEGRSNFFNTTNSKK